MIATRDDWKRQPFTATSQIPYREIFDASQFARLSEGLIPRVMEDKWFIYLEDNHLYFHRSWTGQPIYRLTFSLGDGEYCVTEALCSDEVLEKSDPIYQAELVDFLVHNILLGEAKPFPRPSDIKEQIPGMFQHAISGTGYREKEFARKRWWKFWS